MSGTVFNLPRPECWLDAGAYPDAVDTILTFAAATATSWTVLKQLRLVNKHAAAAVQRRLDSHIVLWCTMSSELLGIKSHYGPLPLGGSPSPNITLDVADVPDDDDLYLRFAVPEDSRAWLEGVFARADVVDIHAPFPFSSSSLPPLARLDPPTVPTVRLLPAPAGVFNWSPVVSEPMCPLFAARHLLLVTLDDTAAASTSWLRAQSEVLPGLRRFVVRVAVGSAPLDWGRGVGIVAPAPLSRCAELTDVVLFLTHLPGDTENGIPFATVCEIYHKLAYDLVMPTRIRFVSVGLENLRVLHPETSKPLNTAELMGMITMYVATTLAEKRPLADLVDGDHLHPGPDEADLDAMVKQVSESFSFAKAEVYRRDLPHEYALLEV